MAVATENGLFAPCLKNVEKMGLVKVNEAVKDIAGRARTGKLKPDELSGGGFTLVLTILDPAGNINICLGCPISACLALPSLPPLSTHHKLEFLQ